MCFKEFLISINDWLKIVLANTDFIKDFFDEDLPFAESDLENVPFAYQQIFIIKDRLVYIGKSLSTIYGSLTGKEFEVEKEPDKLIESIEDWLEHLSRKILDLVDYSRMIIDCVQDNGEVLKEE